MNINLHSVVQLVHASHGLATSNSHNNYNSNNNYNKRQVIPKKKQSNWIRQLLLRQVQSYKLLHVNMYANFLTVPLSVSYYYLDSNHIKLNHVNTVQMTNAANFSTTTRQLLTVSPCSLRQKHIHMTHYARFCTTLHGPTAVAPRPIMSTTLGTPHTPTINAFNLKKNKGGCRAKLNAFNLKKSERQKVRQKLAVYVSLWVLKCKIFNLHIYPHENLQVGMMRVFWAMYQ